MRVSVPVTERIASADGRAQQKALAVTAGARSGEMVEVGECDRSARRPVQKPASLLAPAAVAEFHCVANPAERRHFGGVREQLIGVGDAACWIIIGSAQADV